MQENCYECHNQKKKKGKFNLFDLSDKVNEKNVKLWYDVLDQVKAEEMPPEDDVEMRQQDRANLILLLKEKIKSYTSSLASINYSPVRRMNHIEYENTLLDLFQIEHLGTHAPLFDIPVDAHQHGFNTLANNLVLGSYQLSAYLNTARKILDEIIFEEVMQPQTSLHTFYPKDFLLQYTRQSNGSREKFLDMINPLEHAIAKNNIRGKGKTKKTFRFEYSGYYKIKFQAAGIDRNYPYDEELIGVSKHDPLKVKVHTGTEAYEFILPDEHEKDFELNVWISAGSDLRFSFVTDGLKQQNAGTFKFNANIVKKHLLKKNHPPQNMELLASRKKQFPNANATYWPWHYWEGPTVRIFPVTVEGPYYKAWPPLRQQKLLGNQPDVESAKEIIEKFATRAYARSITKVELELYQKLFKTYLKDMSFLSAIKETLAAILASPAFIYLNDDGSQINQKISKLSYSLTASPPDNRLKSTLRTWKKQNIKNQIESLINLKQHSYFIENFPNAWFEINKLGLMPPEPTAYQHFHRKELVDDMKKEVITFFEKALENNIPIPEFITADYSYINQDLAVIYNIEGIKGNYLRKYQFKDKKRGGILGMGAFLTLTADTIETSPIYRGVWVKENILGNAAKPPPPDLVITAPDLRGSISVRDMLKKHTESKACSSCHATIEPYGWAFENFDVTGAWRDSYTKLKEINMHTSKLIQTVKIDGSGEFNNHDKYKNIVEYKELLSNREEEIVICFIKKLLTYVNGFKPGAESISEIDHILAQSKAADYKIVDTIIAVFQSKAI